MSEASNYGSALSIEEIVHLQDLYLMQEAKSVNFGSQESRASSNERLQSFFVNLQSILKPTITLEIGAHLASFSRKMAKLGIEAHAFEANPYNYSAFSEKVRKRARSVQYHHMAICDRDGEVVFNVKKSRIGKSVNKVAGDNSLLIRRNPAFEYEQVLVPARRLDSFLAENSLENQSFSAWIDVEGALKNVTSGFGHALRNCLSLLVEVEEIAFWREQMLVHEAMKYFTSQGMIPVARDFEYPHQYNIVYVRRDVMCKAEVRLALAAHLQAC